MGVVSRMYRFGGGVPVVRRDDDEPRDGAVPGGEALGVLSGDAGGWAVETSEHDLRGQVSSRHVSS